MKELWEFKQSIQPDTLELYVYGEVVDLEVDWENWCYVQSENSAKHFREALAEHPDVKQINIYINSFGGSVFEGTAIFNQLKRNPAQKTVYIDGFACSIASVIAMAGDKIVMPSNAMMMIHNVWNVVAGNSDELRKAADDLDAIMAGNRQAYLQKTGAKLTEEKLVELLRAETWLTAEECLAYGLCDEIAGQEVDLEQAKEMLQKVNMTLEQNLGHHKALSALAREMSALAEPAPAEPKEEIKNLFAAFKR